MPYTKTMNNLTERTYLVTKKYYITHMIFGWLGGAAITYPFWNSDFAYKNIIFAIAIFGIIFYPAAKWIVEQFTLRITKNEFWSSALFTRSARISGLLGAYWGTIFILTAPILIISTLVFLIKKTFSQSQAS